MMTNEEIQAEIENIRRTLDTHDKEADRSGKESVLKLLGNLLQNINDLAFQANNLEETRRNA